MWNESLQYQVSAFCCLVESLPDSDRIPFLWRIVTFIFRKDIFLEMVCVGHVPLHNCVQLQLWKAAGKGLTLQLITICLSIFVLWVIFNYWASTACRRIQLHDSDMERIVTVLRGVVVFMRSFPWKGRTRVW